MLPSHVVVILLRRAADKLFEVFARKERRVGALVHFFFQFKSGDLAQKKRAFCISGAGSSPAAAGGGGGGSGAFGSTFTGGGSSFGATQNNNNNGSSSNPFQTSPAGTFGNGNNALNASAQRYDNSNGGGGGGVGSAAFAQPANASAALNQGSLFTSSPAVPLSSSMGALGGETSSSMGNVFQRHPSGVNLGYYEPTARAFADGHAQIPSPQKGTATAQKEKGHLREHVAPKFSSMLFSSTQRGVGLNPPQKLEGSSPAPKEDLFAETRRKEMAEREVNFGNVNAKGMPLFTRDAGKSGTVGRGGRRTSIGSRGERGGGATTTTTTAEERMNNEERSRGGAMATTASLGTAYATRNAEVDANDPAAVEAAMASVQTPCWVTVFGFTNDDATFVLSKLQKIGDVVNFGQFLPPNDEEEDTLDQDYENDFKARRRLEESPSRKKSPFSRNADNGFSPRKYHGSPQYTRKFGSHSAIGSANWLHVKFQKPEFAKRALQLNGTRISDRIMIGVKPLSEKDARYIGGVCDDVDDFGSNKRNSIDRSPRGGGHKRTMLNGSASVALQPRRGTWNKVVEFVFGA